jgi:hypothetical protein
LQRNGSPRRGRRNRLLATKAERNITIRADLVLRREIRWEICARGIARLGVRVSCHFGTSATVLGLKQKVDFLGN